MQGDFTRDTFDPRKHFLRVLMQQGRVQLDADFNEQVAILLHYMQTLAADLIGPWGGPGEAISRQTGKGGFKITTRNNDLAISRGRYYVDGILCETPHADERTELSYYKQPFYAPEELPNPPYLVYLDVWERHISHVEDKAVDEDPRIPGIREVALGGPDTTTRSQVVWQVKAVGGVTFSSEQGVKISANRVTFHPAEVTSNPAEARLAFLKLLAALGVAVRPGAGKLKARARIEALSPDPCITAPDARYRGAENQLYRVEIHVGGEGETVKATFKWSRENGSVLFPLHTKTGAWSSLGDGKGSTTRVTLEHLGRDDRFSLNEGDWVEIVDDEVVLSGEAGPLCRVTQVDRIERTVTLTVAGNDAPSVGQDLSKRPYLRRWDQRPADGSGAISVEATRDDGWIELEDGIEVQFQHSGQGPGYHTGDYWLIPARTATGDVEWPQQGDDPEPRPPHGIEHHYAPLAIVLPRQADPVDLRRLFGLLGKVVTQ